MEKRPSPRQIHFFQIFIYKIPLNWSTSRMSRQFFNFFLKKKTLLNKMYYTKKQHLPRLSNREKTHLCSTSQVQNFPLILRCRNLIYQINTIYAETGEFHSNLLVFEARSDLFNTIRTLIFSPHVIHYRPRLSFKGIQFHRPKEIPIAPGVWESAMHIQTTVETLRLTNGRIEPNLTRPNTSRACLICPGRSLGAVSSYPISSW